MEKLFAHLCVFSLRVVYCYCVFHRRRQDQELTNRAGSWGTLSTRRPQTHHLASSSATLCSVRPFVFPHTTVPQSRNIKIIKDYNPIKEYTREIPVSYYLDQCLSACQCSILYSANDIISYICCAKIVLVMPTREAE